MLAALVITLIQLLVWVWWAQYFQKDPKSSPSQWFKHQVIIAPWVKTEYSPIYSLGHQPRGIMGCIQLSPMEQRTCTMPLFIKLSCLGEYPKVWNMERTEGIQHRFYEIEAWYKFSSPCFNILNNKRLLRALCAKLASVGSNQGPTLLVDHIRIRCGSTPVTPRTWASAY